MKKIENEKNKTLYKIEEFNLSIVEKIITNNIFDVSGANIE